MFDDVKNKKEDNTIPSGPSLAQPKPGDASVGNQEKKAPLNNQTGQAPLDSKHPKGQAEDIFADTDQPVKPDVFHPKAKEAADLSMGREERKTAPVSAGEAKKYIVIAVIVLGAALIVYAGYWAYGKYFKAAPVSEEISEEAADQPDSSMPDESTQPEIESEPAYSQPDDISESLMQDSDQDGLTDEEEKQIGTNPNSVDSDDDGLFDREEVKVYQTDPLNADTDGDGFLDGDEVKDGYNPKGTGKLYEIY